MPTQVKSQAFPEISSQKSNDVDNTIKASTDVHIVIVGAGMAGSRLAIMLAKAYDSLAANNCDTKQCNHRITLISKEPQVGYNRIMLSPVLAGEKKFSDTYLYDTDEYENLGIKVIAGAGVQSIDNENQQLELDNGENIGYHKLVIATGSTARVIPFEGYQAPQVHVFRDVNDVEKLVSYAKKSKKGLVIGGGVLGLEAACALSAQGADMTVIHVDDYVLNRQLDEPAALLLQEELARRNVGLKLSTMTESIELDKDGNVIGLATKDGRIIKTDFIVMAVGIIPNIELAAKSGIKVNRGIIVDNHMQTSLQNIYAIGECVEINEELFGMVSSVNQHVDSLISVLTSLENKQNWQPFVSVPLTLKLKVSGVDVFSAGKISFDEEEIKNIEQIIYQYQDSSRLKDQYHCLYIKDNILVGAVMYGETSDGSFYSQLVNEEIDITEFKDSLIYGEAFCKDLMENSVTDSVEETDIVTDTQPNHTTETDKTSLASDAGEVA